MSIHIIISLFIYISSVFKSGIFLCIAQMFLSKAPYMYNKLHIRYSVHFINSCIIVLICPKLAFQISTKQVNKSELRLNGFCFILLCHITLGVKKAAQ